MRCVDLFAGAGGLSLAAKQAGVEIVAAVEKNAYACETYRTNLIGKRGRIKLYEQDILELAPNTLATDNFRRGVACDLLLGGPPCQGFSTHRIKDAGVGDPRNELVLRYFAFVAALRPKLFLMENVPGILWPRHKGFLSSLFREAKAAGYNMHEPVVLDARDYGVPQRRKRVFVLGVRSDVRIKAPWPPAATHGSPSAVAADAKLKPWNTAATVFSPIRKDDPNNVHMQHSAALVEVFRSTPPNGGSRHESTRTLACHKNHDGHTDVYGRIDPTAPGPTMTTACVNPSKGRFVHPTQHHGISVRHAARFQTFPDDFEFHGGLTASAEQIGNAVPILLGKILVKFLMKNLAPMRRKKSGAQRAARQDSTRGTARHRNVAQLSIRQSPAKARHK